MPATRARPAMTRNAIRFEENALRVEEDAPSFESTFQGIRKSMWRSRHSQDFDLEEHFPAAVGRISDASSWNSRDISESDGRVAWGDDQCGPSQRLHASSRLGGFQEPSLRALRSQRSR